MEKKTKLTISGGIAKKSIKNIDKAKNLGKNSVIIEKQTGKFTSRGASFKSNSSKIKIIIKNAGKNLIQVCRTSPCWLRGSDKITDTICKEAKCGINETSKDNLFTVVEVECLGACSNGPMIQINNDFYEDLDQESTKQIIENIKNNIPNKIGSQKGRKSSENA